MILLNLYDLPNSICCHIISRGIWIDYFLSTLGNDRNSEIPSVSKNDIIFVVKMAIMSTIDQLNGYHYKHGPLNCFNCHLNTKCTVSVGLACNYVANLANQTNR